MEKRALNRLSLPDRLRVCERHSGEFIGWLENLSINGMMLVTERPVEVDQTVECEIRLAQPLFGSNTITLEARCMWCKRTAGAVTYSSGYLLLRVAPEEREKLNSLVGQILARESKSQV